MIPMFAGWLIIIAIIIVLYLDDDDFDNFIF